MRNEVVINDIVWPKSVGVQHFDDPVCEEYSNGRRSLYTFWVKKDYVSVTLPMFQSKTYFLNNGYFLKSVINCLKLLNSFSRCVVCDIHYF